MGGVSYGGFTLTELLVVVAIIAVLASLLLGGLATAQFRSRVTSCANNFRQWGIAVNLYASEDPAGRLPAYAIPLADFAGYGDVLPWMVSRVMATNLGRYGVTVPLWFCPVRAEALQSARRELPAFRPGATLSSLTELTDYWEWEVRTEPKRNPRSFAVIEYNWLVPRPLSGSPSVYPDPKVLRCRIPDGWPTKLEDPAGGVQPIMTDLIAGRWNEDKTAIETSMGTVVGGHPFPRFFTRSINALFVDGHVETRGIGKLQWQIEMGDFGHTVIPY